MNDDFTSHVLNTNALISLIAVAVWLLMGVCLWQCASKFASQLVAEDLNLMKTIRNAESDANNEQPPSDASSSSARNGVELEDRLIVKSMKRAFRRSTVNNTEKMSIGYEREFCLFVCLFYITNLTLDLINWDFDSHLEYRF